MPGPAAETTQRPPSAKELNGHPQIPQGGLFNLPGITYWSEQTENNDGMVVTLSQSNTVAAQFSSSLTNTDILYRELIDVDILTTQALNGGTVFTSAYMPYNYIGAMSINMQNQFNSIDVPSGADIKLLNLIRPRYYDSGDSIFDTNPNRNLTNGVQALISTFTAAPAFTQAAAHIKFTVDVPFGIWFDRYFDLDPDGQLRNLVPMRAFVTPQLMAGVNRVISPKIAFNPILASDNDQGPFVINAGAPTATLATATLGWQRKLVYQPRSQTDTPLLWGWQYSFEAKQYQIGVRSTADITLPTTGQLLMVYYRLYDPAAASGGAPIALANVKNVNLQYGSGLFKFQDNALRAQYRFQNQHKNRLPFEGVIVHDMVLDEQGYASNQNALNTLDTSSVKVHFDFTGAQSSSSYVVIGVEALRYVVQQ